MDNLTAEQRHKTMARVRGANTKLELGYRKLVFKLGYRYRLHAPNLPGKPDMVFPKRRKAIFIHGCFWHQHDCDRAKIPNTNRKYWKDKLERNKKRDGTVVFQLESLGWSVLTIWECEMKNMVEITRLTKEFLGRSKDAHTKFDVV